MRRIDFQLPFDVMWLFRHNQLHKEPDVPQTREISSYQPKEKSLSSHQTWVSLPPSPQEECSSPSKKLFPYLDMEPMTTSDRVFVLKHRVFLLRNWERGQRQTDTPEEGERGGTRERWRRSFQLCSYWGQQQPHHVRSTNGGEEECCVD
ncbi:histone-lysine N-methyltransferase ASH1L-like isoform X2 [Oncorhynchus nerka]|uniref:histone-lysine N-methyltransferase ASH1L-like isoform X2 n=1 Tax=Oncorhynchus nerka TaxID=8023 RepID=UPI0031B89EB9